MPATMPGGLRFAVRRTRFGEPHSQWMTCSQVWWLSLRVTLEKSKEYQIVLYCATDNNVLPQIYLKWKFLYAYLCQNPQSFCNSDTKIKLRHQKGVDCTFFGIFSELLRGTAKYWESKNENIAFLSDQLIPILSFTLKGFISAVSDLLGHFFQYQNQITKTGGLWLSATVLLAVYSVQ